tara:strand:+ start:953 stop:1831 length:879 start_codon:yes stop_codon:yes gene_type:complete
MNKHIQRKGIILAGGTGSRLYPLTKAVSKQLMPIFNKPMIYYALCILMMTGIKDILIIVNDKDLIPFKRLLGDGSNFGITLNYAIQKKPEGIAQSFLIGKEFIKDNDVALILGDNLFHGNNIIEKLKNANSQKSGATIFAYPVSNPENYGVIEFKDKKVFKIIEKPSIPPSKYAVTGLYFYDKTIVERAKNITPSQRGELEITSINQSYINDNSLNIEYLNRGTAWLDTGTFESLHEAGAYIRTLEKRQSLKIGCPEEIAWRQNWINDEKLKSLAEPLIKSGYGDYLLSLLG